MEKYLTTEQLKELIKKYENEKISISKLSKEYGLSVYIISKLLKSNGIEVINRQNQFDFSIEDDILPLYNSGMSLTKIAEQFNTTRATLSRNLKKLGVEIVNRQNLTKFNENVFDVIDTEEKAYWLGFLYADGSVSTNNNAIELSLSIVDIEHLYKFNSFMQHNKDNVKVGSSKCNGKTFKRCRWSVVNKHLKETLISLGCVPNKSLTLTFPNPEIFKSKNLIKDFIRGYFDGDGCISYCYTNRTLKDKVSPKCVILGTKDFLEELSTHIPCLGIIRPKSSGNVYVLEFSQNVSRQLLQYLYVDSNIYLDRKYKLANFLMYDCRSVKEFTELLQTNIGEGCDANTEISSEIKESEPSYSIEIEPDLSE